MPFILCRRTPATLVLFCLSFASAPVAAQTRIFFCEPQAAGKIYRVNIRVDLNGKLTLPPEKGKSTTKELTISGRSRIDYDERIYSVEKTGKITKSIRKYARMDFERTVGGQKQQSELRQAVSRLVILRKKQLEVPFSPDGPLNWNEIDLVRTDVFTPALAGLLPKRSVRTGERWTAATSAIQELTDLERLDSGAVTCNLADITTIAGRRHARVSFHGTVRGVNEDGPCRQTLSGFYYFDLSSNHLNYLSMRGELSMLDPKGKEVGKISGRFVVTRQPLKRARGLGDADLRGLALEPNDDNTLLVYGNAEFGVRFLYPRRWRVAGENGRQLGLDSRDGSGIMLTFEPPQRTPTGRKFLQESRGFLAKRNVTVTNVDAVQMLQRTPSQIEQFTLDVAENGRRFRLYYLVVSTTNGGVIIAARLQLRDIKQLQSEVQRIARSIEVTKMIR